MAVQAGNNAASFYFDSITVEIFVTNGKAAFTECKLFLMKTIIVLKYLALIVKPN